MVASSDLSCWRMMAIEAVIALVFVLSVCADKEMVDPGTSACQISWKVESHVDNGLYYMQVEYWTSFDEARNSDHFILFEIPPPYSNFGAILRGIDQVFTETNVRLEKDQYNTKRTMLLAVYITTTDYWKWLNNALDFELWFHLVYNFYMSSRSSFFKGGEN